MEHHLQTAWADDRADKEYQRRIEALLHSGNPNAAADILMADLASLNTPLAEHCRALTVDSILLDGWADMNEAIAQYEGNPITAVHILMSNDDDLVFEDRMSEVAPIIEVAFYSDEHMAFSRISREQLLAQCLQDNVPSWYGQSEDIEAYLDVQGLTHLNGALLRHKRQYYFRDQMHTLDARNNLAADTAPILYVEFRLAVMLYAVRYHQAVKKLVDRYGVPGNLPVIVDMDNMKLDMRSVYMSQSAKVLEFVRPHAPLSVTIRRSAEAQAEPAPVGHARNLRQQYAQEAEPEKKRGGFLRRLFGLK